MLRKGTKQQCKELGNLYLGRQITHLNRMVGVDFILYSGAVFIIEILSILLFFSRILE